MDNQTAKSIDRSLKSIAESLKKMERNTRPDTRMMTHGGKMIGVKTMSGFEPTVSSSFNPNPMTPSHGISMKTPEVRNEVDIEKIAETLTKKLLQAAKSGE